MKTVFYKFKLLFTVTALACIMTSCGDDEGTTPEPNPTASFTFEVDAENPLKVTFTNTSENGTTYAWDFGDDSGASTDENPSYTYSQGGTYTVTLTVTNEGGSDVASKDVTVTAPDTNLISGGDMEDQSAWTIYATDMSETSVEFTDGQLIFSNTENSQTNILVWQAVEVEAGDYVFSADISGAGATQSWLEVYFGTTEPVEKSDYTENLYTGLNTWDGCGTSEFNENLAVLGCKLIDGTPAPGNGQNGAVTFTEAGTIYFVLKAGSWDGHLGEGGIAVDNVVLTKTE